MSREREDNSFSEEGVLYQVEYALEGAKKGMPCVVVCGRDCVVMAASKRLPEKLMDPEYISSFFEILPGLAGVISGYLMDVQVAVQKVKKKASKLLYDLGQAPSPYMVARAMADEWELYTQENARRLPAVFLSIIGFEMNMPIISYTDSSGVLIPYSGVAFGEGSNVMMKRLEKIYTENQTEEKSIEDALISLSEALGHEYLAINVELASLHNTKEPLRRFTTDEIDSYLVQIAEKE
ncbi:20S proteasome subunit alpha 1 [Nematocida sp. AWRm80]|nr:20S proteasome subunit alpha 1 [Nematocida sp. AWRm80]